MNLPKTDQLVNNHHSTKRNNSIEVLRILSMLLILMHHYAVHGGFSIDPSTTSVNKILIQFLSAGGKLGVNCFILITGYFMINSRFKLEKLLRLILTVFTYSAIIYLIALGTGYVDFNIKQALRSFFPVTFNEYWFITSFVLLYIFSPYINALIHSLDKKQHLKLILILITVWSVVPTILSANLNFSPIGWFITLYIISAYIRLYPNHLLDNQKLSIILAIVSYLIILLLIITLDTLSIGMNKLPMLFCAVTLFLGFKNSNITNNKYVGVIASSMLGVYLIHDNNILRNWLWIDQFKNNNFYDSDYLLLHAFASTLFIFFSCIVTDQLIKLILERPLAYITNRISDFCRDKAKYLQHKSKLLINKYYSDFH